MKDCVSARLNVERQEHSMGLKGSKTERDGAFNAQCCGMPKLELALAADVR